MKNLSRGIAWGLVALAAVLGSAVGDIIHLKSGKVEGTILKKTEDEIVVQTSVGKITLNPSDVVSIERKSSPMEVYRQMAAKVGDKDADGHFALGLWCTDQKLFGEAHKQYEAAIAIDPNHKSAREKLGYVLKDGKWLTRTQAKEADGFVRMGDAWVTPEQRDAAANKDAANSWVRRLRAAIAKGQMTADAVTARVTACLGDKAGEPGEIALRTVFAEMIKAAQSANRDREADARVALLDLINQQKGPEPLDHVRRAAVGDPSDSVRGVAVKRLAAQKAIENTAYFVGLLREYTGPRYRLTGDKRTRSVARRVLRRAAEALGELGDPRAIPALADAMFIRFYIPENADDSTPPMSLGFSNTRLGGATTVTDARGNQYSVPVTEGTNYGLGGSDPEKEVEDPIFFNDAAYSSLRKLSGQDFSHDKRAWLAWWYRNRFNFEE
jgi:hypothetical protein